MNDWPAIADIAKDVNSGKLKALDLVKKSLQAIADKQDYDATISTLEDRALERAAQIDKNPQGRLAGVPFIAKDNFLTFGGKTTAASNILRPFEAPYQATAINKLEAEGAICVAKANLDAFAHGSSTENSDWFTTKNPLDKTRVPGGSSGGSAAALPELVSRRKKVQPGNSGSLTVEPSSTTITGPKARAAFATVATVAG